MDRRILLLDLILVLILGSLTVRARQAWIEYQASHDVAAIQPEEEIDVSIAEASAIERPPGEDAWRVVSELNPFSPDRNDVPVLAPVPDAEEIVSSPTPEPVVFGTLLLGNDQVALLGPRFAPVTYTTVRVGETFEGWELVEVGRKYVVVEAGGARRTVRMNDPSVLIPRSNLRTAGSSTPEIINPTPPAPEQAITRPPATAAPSQPAQPRATGTAPTVIQTPFGPTTIPAPQ